MAPKRPIGAGAIPTPVESPAPSLPDRPPLYAALDLGTNSCRMLIARPEGAQFHVVDSFSKSDQLGAGLERSGRLSRAAIYRTIQALRVCHQKLRRHRVARMRLVATEACRRATNGREFMARIERETGLRLDIIPPEAPTLASAASLMALPSTRMAKSITSPTGAAVAFFVPFAPAGASE